MGDSISKAITDAASTSRQARILPLQIGAAIPRARGFHGIGPMETEKLAHHSGNRPRQVHGRLVSARVEPAPCPGGSIPGKGMPDSCPESARKRSGEEECQERKATAWETGKPRPVWVSERRLTKKILEKIYQQDRPRRHKLAIRSRYVGESLFQKGSREVTPCHPGRPINSGTDRFCRALPWGCGCRRPVPKSTRSGGHPAS